jgi:hypothetical protein
LCAVAVGEWEEVGEPVVLGMEREGVVVTDGFAVLDTKVVGIGCSDE